MKNAEYLDTTIFHDPPRRKQVCAAQVAAEDLVTLYASTSTANDQVLAPEHLRDIFVMITVAISGFGQFEFVVWRKHTREAIAPPFIGQADLIRASRS